jgi:hypothetical protein
VSFRRCKFSIDRGKVAIDRGEFSNQRVPFSTRRVQVSRNPWRFALVRCWGAGGGGQHRSGDGPSPRRSHSVNRASCDFVRHFVRVHVRFVHTPSRRAAKSTHGARLRDVATPLPSVVHHVRLLAFRLILLIARVPNFRQTICASAPETPPRPARARRTTRCPAAARSTTAPRRASRSRGRCGFAAAPAGHAPPLSRMAQTGSLLRPPSCTHFVLLFLVRLLLCSGTEATDAQLLASRDRSRRALRLRGRHHHRHRRGDRRIRLGQRRRVGWQFRRKLRRLLRRLLRRQLGLVQWILERLLERHVQRWPRPHQSPAQRRAVLHDGSSRRLHDPGRQQRQRHLHHG